LHFSLLQTSLLLSSLQFPSTMRLQIVATILLIAMLSGAFGNSSEEILAEMKKTGTGVFGQYLIDVKAGRNDEWDLKSSADAAGKVSKLLCDSTNPAVERLWMKLVKVEEVYERLEETLKTAMEPTPETAKFCRNRSYLTDEAFGEMARCLCDPDLSKFICAIKTAAR
ncbi:hypothetical protein PFISCL1PPCAC_256, partial [Pristionchus fissidentatus]